MPIAQGKKKPRYFSLKLKTALYFLIISVLPLIITNLLFVWYFNESSEESVTFLAVLFTSNLVMILLLIWLITTELFKPISAFKKIYELVHKGDFRFQLKVNSKDDLEELAESTNQMIEIMQNYAQKISYEKLTLLGQYHKANAVLSTITDAVIAVDFQRNIIIFNKPAEIMTGWSESQVLGQPISQVIKVFDKRDELSSLIYCPVGSSPNVIFSRNNLRVTGNQSEVYVNILTRQIPEGQNINLGSILTLHDITHEKQLEAMKLDFVSMAAHELRTPLTTIKGYLSVFMEENTQRFTGDQKMFLDRISHSTEQLISLVENLLNVSRVERGTFSVFRQEIEWTEIVKKVVTDLKAKAQEKKITLSYHDTGLQNLMVEADKLRLTEVVTNLIANAINYTPVGGQVVVWIETDGKMVTTHIKDTGVGIPKEAQSHLFTKFYRVQNKFGTTTKGTGLGLYISKAIIDLHHGRIWVDSEVGKGSIFSFTLPIPQIVKPLAMPVSQNL